MLLNIALTNGFKRAKIAGKFEFCLNVFLIAI